LTLIRPINTGAPYIDFLSPLPTPPPTTYQVATGSLKTCPTEISDHRGRFLPVRHLLDCHQQTVEDPNDFPSDTLPYRRLGSDPFDVWSVNAVLRYIAARPDPSTYNTARHRLRLLAHPRGALLSIIIISASVSCSAVFNPSQRLPFEAPHCMLVAVCHSLPAL